MARHDFDVDIQALANAAKGIADAAKLFKDKDVVDLLPSSSDVGDAGLSSAIDEFQDRWERGTKNMVEDAQEAGGRLGKIAMNFIAYEQEAAKPFTALQSDIASLRLHGLS